MAKLRHKERQFGGVRFGADLFCDESPIFIFEVQGHGGPPHSTNYQATLKARTGSEQKRSLLLKTDDACGAYVTTLLRRLDD